MEKKKIVVIICIAVSVISIFMIICQTKNNKEKDEFANAAVKTTATIEKIVTEKSIKWSRRNRRSSFRTVTTYYALASYEVDEKTYKNVKMKCSYKKKKGEQIDIYYLPNKPSGAKSGWDLEKENTPILYFVALVGIALAWGVHSEQISLNRS